MVGSVLRTPISAKYCWFGWWLGAWSTPSHDPTQLCDIYISGYKYTLISEWTRLFGLLRILDNLIAGAVCYFCTTISVFCEIYTLRMRVVAHAAIVWVGCFFMPSSGVGLVYLSPSGPMDLAIRDLLQGGLVKTKSTAAIHCILNSCEGKYRTYHDIPKHTTFAALSGKLNCIFMSIYETFMIIYENLSGVITQSKCKKAYFVCSWFIDYMDMIAPNIRSGNIKPLM